MCDASGRGDYIYIDTVRLSVLEPASPSAYALWVSSQGLDAAESDQTLDPDDDGKNNLLEYALGGVPTDGSDGSSLSPTSTHLEDAGTYWVDYVYRRRTDAATRGLSYETQHSGTLAPESWSSTGFTETSIAPIDSDFESATSRILAEGIDQLFIRLEIKSSE
jgi:hypothetical protein